MELENVFPVADLSAHARRAGKPNDTKSVKPQLVDEEVSKGWSISKERKATVSLTRPKSPDRLFEDRVWALLHRMGFGHMSGKGGAILKTGVAGATVDNQLDVVAIDDEVIIYAECRTATNQKRSANLVGDFTRMDSFRRPIVQSVSALVSRKRRKVASVFWSMNLIISDNDRQRADSLNIRLFDADELSYYEDLARQIGEAARFQFLADVFAGADIPGLEMVVPAVRSHMGGKICYTFPIAPGDLLKIAYVSHRAKGKPADVDTYQRLIKSSRIKQIRDYISNNGFFPTNIVLNIANGGRHLRFDLASIPKGHDEVVREVGWLYLPPRYKSAWVIDGQHRLFAFAGHERASSSILAALAFENLAPDEQAKLFVDINAKQKTVKQDLLLELWANLHWNSEDLASRVRATISKLILRLDIDPESPLLGRVRKADEVLSDVRCISLPTLASALQKPEFFAQTVKGVVQPGAFWCSNNEKTLARSRRIVNHWVASAIGPVKDVWDLGRGAGGVFGMNDPMTVIINVLRSALRYMSDNGIHTNRLDDSELCEKLDPFATALGNHFASLSSQQLAEFRALRGVQGQAVATKRCQAAISIEIPNFKPEGLEEFIKATERNTSEEADRIVKEIELELHAFVLSELKEEFGEKEESWFFNGVPLLLRKRVDNDRNEEAAQTGKVPAREQKFYLIDFRDLISHNWDLLKDVLAQGKKNTSRDKGTAWLVRINEIRKTAAHPTRGPVSIEDLEFLKQQQTWLKEALSGRKHLAEASEEIA